MKTKNPKCCKCGKVMKVIYTKESYKINNKYKTYWSKKGYICNHTYYPIVIITTLKEYGLINYLIDTYDIDLKLLFKSLRKIFKFF